MSTITKSDCKTIIYTVKPNNEAFHDRLQRLYPCTDDVTKLPQAWSTETKASQLGLTYDNLGCYIRTGGRKDDDIKMAAAARANNYIPPSCLLYYFEIKIISKGRDGYMGVGLASESVSLDKLPGWARESYGYHADDGRAFSSESRGHPFGPTFTTGDVIGCGYNLVEGSIFFTKNGLNLGKAFEDIPSNVHLYPTIGLKTFGEEMHANFGQEEFVYDIEQDLRSLRKNMTLTISGYPIDDFNNWQNTIHTLVQSWLLQNSYPKTAEAFSRSAKIECREDLERLQQRYRIQQLVLQGRISEAIRLTNRLCPKLLQNNSDLLFVLKCRQFIELIGGAENDYQTIFNYAEPDTANNGISREGANGGGRDDISDGHKEKNGCNGSLNSKDNCDAHRSTGLHQSGSSSSLQDLMEIDQPAIVSPSNDTKSTSGPTPMIPTLNNSNHITDSPQNIVPNHSSPAPGHIDNNKLGTNGNTSTGGDQACTTKDDNDCEDNEQRIIRLLQFGRELSDYLEQMVKMNCRNETNEKMLQDAIALIAYSDPKNSSFGKLLDPREREPISQLLNSSILKEEMGDSYRPALEEVMNHLRRLSRLNDSHGVWLVDRLY